MEYSKEDLMEAKKQCARNDICQNANWENNGVLAICARYF